MDIQHHIRKESIINGVTNAFFNGLAAWLLLKSHASMPFLGQQSIVGDFMATAAILLFIIALILIPLNRSKVRKGKLASISLDANNRLHRILSRFPQSLFGRALVFALIGLLILAPITLIPMALVGIEELAIPTFVVVKSIWAGIIASLMVGPMILLAASSEPAPATAE